MTLFNTITTRRELAEYIYVPYAKITYLIFKKGINNCYNTFEIPKKSGGVRQINAPDESLKDVQSRLAYALWEHQEAINAENNIRSNVSHAFEKKKSIFTNAQIHHNKRFVVNIDLKDFFDSFHFGRVCGFFEKNKYYELPHEVAVTIAQLSCYKRKLPQGAPTSPIITNIMCQILDNHILGIAKKYHLDYTRYADDLTFSTNNKTFMSKWEDFYCELEKEITRSGFAINQKKTRVQFKDSKQVVTGLVVNKKISVDHNYYKQVRAMAHSLYSTGKYHVNSVEGTVAQLEGRFAFINQIDKYNNKKDAVNKHGFFCLNGREKQYQKFLFYKYFFDTEKPIIVTEGKTDVRYLKAALKKMYSLYPSLIEKDASGNFKYKVAFFKRSKRLRYFFNISLDGADTIGNIYKFYIDENERAFPNYFADMLKLGRTPANPIILLYDNEISNRNKPIHKFLNSNGIGKAKQKRIGSIFKSEVVGQRKYIYRN